MAITYCYGTAVNLLQSEMTPLESSVSDATLELSITILEASFTLVYDVYSTGISYEDHQLMRIINIRQG